MDWKISYSEDAIKQLKRLDKSVQNEIITYLHERIECSENPRRFGKQLRYNLKEYWVYRVGDYRILCLIKDQVVTIVVAEVEHRRSVYK